MEEHNRKKEEKENRDIAELKAARENAERKLAELTDKHEKTQDELSKIGLGHYLEQRELESVIVGHEMELAKQVVEALNQELDDQDHPPPHCHRRSSQGKRTPLPSATTSAAAVPMRGAVMGDVDY